ncbi:hypothetical protein WA026_016257 [Henosepilachna vigintioctopunctata]|uniref:diphosphoinositol-polyphosphate diphosphatase n=1 Tax=Henosepilachna vigintioctopunctata TaxID=420089 RepID=A0AAW1TU59_9CUCU
MVKEKPNSIRMYDEEGFRRRAACICVRSEDETEILLVNSSRCPEKWVVPGGGIEPDEESNVAATREVLEEAGVIGKLGRYLGVFYNHERRYRTEVYVMMVTDELEEWEESKSMGRTRRWFTVDEALKQLGRFKPMQSFYIHQLRATKPEQDLKIS